MKILLKMLFLFFCDINICFTNNKLEWKKYIVFINKKRVKIVYWKEFITAALNLKEESFVIYIFSLSTKDINIHQSKRVSIASVLKDKALVDILSDYTNYTNIFLLKASSKINRVYRNQ